MAKSGKEWQGWQRVAKSGKEWQRVAKSGKEWQRANVIPGSNKLSNKK